MTKLTVAIFVPTELGSKVTWKVIELLPLKDAMGKSVIVKSSALVPVMVAKGLPAKPRGKSPWFSMVKVLVMVPLLTLTPPKSVSSAVSGVVSLLAIATEFPETLIS